MTTPDIHQLDRRRAILAALVIAPANRMPRASLREQLHVAGYAASGSQIAEDLAWLATHGLVEWDNEVITLSEAGADMAINRGAFPRTDPFFEAATEARRALILTLLAQSPERSASAHLLASAMPAFRHAGSLRQIKADLSWLTANGLITQQDSAGVRFACLTAEGLDVAEDRSTVAGVARPRPAA